MSAGTPIQGSLAAAGFKSMPFRIVPPTDMENVQWAGDRAPIDALYDAARAPRDDFLSTSELVVLFGEFGSGKTNALKWLAKRLRSEGQLVAYVLKPSVADKPVWHDVVRSLFTQSFSKADLVTRLTPLRKHLLVESKKRARELLGSTADEDPDALAALEAEKRHEIALEVVPDHPGFVDFVADLCDSTSPSLQNRNWAYLADKPSAADGKAIASQYGLPADGIGSDWSATLVLSSLIQAVSYRTGHGIGSEVVCILMDEVEDVNDLPAGSRLSILQGLRDLFNACTEHLYIALAITASDASEIYGVLDQPLMNRLSRQPVQFPQLGPTEAEAFLTEVISLHRLNDYSGAAEWPFSVDGLQAFVQECPQPLTPRKLLVSAQRLVFQQQLAKVASGQPIDASDVADFTAWGAS